MRIRIFKPKCLTLVMRLDYRVNFSIKLIRLNLFKGGSIATLHSTMIDNNGQSTMGIDKSQLIKAARRLLSSVTRVLTLADRVMVKHILRAEDKVFF